MHQLNRKNIKDILALTPTQEGILFHYLQHPQNDFFVEQLSLRVSGFIDRDLFQKAWNRVTDSNDMLRCAFRWEKIEKPTQIIFKTVHHEPAFHDLSKLTDSETKRHLDAIQINDKKRLSDLRQVPFHITLCLLETGNPNRYAMIITHHHILYDGWSTGVLLREFFASYRQLTNGESLILPIKTGFKEFIKWIHSQDRTKQDHFWHHYLKDFDTGTQETSTGRRNVTDDTAIYNFQLPGELKTKIDAFTKRVNITLSSFLYGVWGLLLQTYHSVRDVIFDTTVSGRRATIDGIEDMVGLLINTLPLRIQRFSDDTPTDFFTRINAMMTEWTEYEHTPSLRVKPYLDRCRRANRFDSVVVIENYPLDRLTIDETTPLAIDSFSMVEKTAYDLTVIVTLVETIEFHVTYHTDGFDHKDMSKLADDLISIMNDIPENSGKPLCDMMTSSVSLTVKLPSEILEREYHAPRNAEEETLSSIWAEVLNIRADELGIDANVFDFGGHSLSVQVAASRIHRALGVKVPIEAFFNRPTIRLMGEYIDHAGRQTDVSVSVPVAEEREYDDVSPAQKRIYMLQQLNPESTAYNGPWIMKLEGAIDQSRLEWAFKELIARHDILRTSFELHNGEPVQRVHDIVPFQINYIKEPKPKVFAELFSKSDPTESVFKSFIRSFQLSKLPLFRVLLNECFLIIDMHHIITDGTSTAVLIHELSALYNGDALAPLHVRYSDFTRFLHQRLERGELRSQETYWLEHLSGELPVLTFPTDFPRPLMQNFSGERILFQFDDELTDRLRGFMKERGVTLYMTLLSILNIVLAYDSGQEDIIVGTPISGRNYPDIEYTVGLFLETLAMRNFPSGDKSFLSFLNEVKTHTLRAYENREYPFDRLIKRVTPMDGTNDRSRNPLFDVMLNVLNQPQSVLRLNGVTVTPVEFAMNTSKVDMTLEVMEKNGKIILELEYCTALFKAETMQRFLNHFRNTLREAIVNSNVLLGEISVIDESERREILEAFNAVSAFPETEKTVIDMFDEQVEKTPDRIAVMGPASVGALREAPLKNSCGAIRELPLQITYRQLNEESNRFANRLIEKGIQPDTIVAIMMERSVEMIIGLLGILKAGGAYLPIDVDAPQERKDFMLKDSAAACVCPGAHMGAPLQRKVSVGADLCVCPGAHAGAPLHLNKNSAIAYIIYTSGSTGQPKGVAVTHQNLTGYIHAFQHEFHINQKDIIMQQASVSFDVFVEETYPCLLAGAKLMIAPKDVIRDTSLLVEFIARHQLTVIDCSPLLLNELNQWISHSQNNPLQTVHTFISGGDVLKKEYIANLLPFARVYNTYGPTETTVCASYYRITGTETSSIPIGKPIKNDRILILDKYHRLLPVGITGELCVSGSGVTNGYLNQPLLTYERFCLRRPTFLKKGGSKNFWFEKFGGGFYKTGDIGRWLPDGNIEFVGRKDRQVKIRGFRIELGEIEARLLTHPDILDTVAMVLPTQSICVYFTAKEEKEINANELREFLSQHLPSYMIPAFFFQLQHLPIGSTGKVNLNALPKPMDSDQSRQTPYIPPQNEIESQLVAIWQNLLGHSQIGTMDNFFDLGGDSIQVNRCIAAIRECLHIEIPFRTFFVQPYIQTLAREITGRHAGLPLQKLIKKQQRPSLIPLSFPQERLWFLQHLDTENTAYFVPRVVRIIGELNVRLLERTFSEIIRRHEILRTVFITRNGTPVQIIKEPYPFTIPVIDINRDDVTEWINREGRQPFDFEHGPLLRVTILKQIDKSKRIDPSEHPSPHSSVSSVTSVAKKPKKNEHLLVLTEHHLIHDGWTQGVLLKEFITIFSAYTEGKKHDLPELDLQYADFAIWQREFLQGDRLNRHLDYWKEKLTGLIPLLELPGDRPRPTVMSGNGALKMVHLSVDLSAQLEEFSRKNGLTLFMVMLAAFNILLYRYSGEEDICVGTGIANRGYKEMEGMLGMVINTLPLRTHTVGSLSLTDYLNRVKETCLEAYRHQDTPLGKIVEVLAPERSLSYNPLFQVMYSFMDTPTEDLWLPGLELHLEPTHNRSSKFDINIVVVPARGQENREILVEWEYSTDIFDDSTAERMCRHYNRLMQQIVSATGETVSSLLMLEPEEIKQLVDDWNDTSTDYPRDKTIHQLFEDQVERTPDHVAVVGQKTFCFLTYRQLNEECNRLAKQLIEKGIQPDSIVAIMMERSIEMIIAILGILKAGGAYLPIDVNAPQERKDFMLKDSAAACVCSGAHAGAPLHGKISVGADLCVCPGAHAGAPLHLNKSSTIAYIIYTSGSTGKPKGVLINHRHVVRLLFNDRFQFDFTCRDIWTLFHSYCFDFSVWEMYGSLLYGGKLILVPRTTAKDTAAFLRLLNREAVTVLNQTPSAFYHLINEDLNNRETGQRLHLKYVIFGGEALNPSKLSEWKSRYPQTKMINMYGITETTVHVTFKALDETDMASTVSVIGKPIPTLQMYLMDNYLNPVPIGVPGEIYVGGEGVARGYLNNPELTSEKFTGCLNLSQTKSFCPAFYKKRAAGGNLYKTGDLGRWLNDGNVEYLGRIDSQVKIRGFRIELGEIERALLKHQDINEAAVIDRIDDHGDKYLVAYVVSEKTFDSIDIKELKHMLSVSLPDYMIPSQVMTLDRIPLTPNGKLDRKALPVKGTDVSQRYEAPRDHTERQLVDIWRQVLGREGDIGIDDNFFELGGHSLKAAVFISTVHKELNAPVTLQELFTGPTIRELADTIREKAPDHFVSIEPAEEKEYYGVSSAQKRLYTLQTMNPESTAYHIPLVLHMPHDVTINHIETIIRRLIERHESLRTSFHLIDDQPVQRIHDRVEFEVSDLATEVTEHTEWGKKKVRSEEDKTLSKIKSFIRSFDLITPPLIRVGLIEQNDHTHLLIVDMHHMITDGVSLDILTREFAVLYGNGELSPLAFQYKDYAEWEQRGIGTDGFKRREAFWLNELSGEIPVLELPVDVGRPAVQSFEGRRESFEIDRETIGALQSIVSENGATLYMTLLTLYTVFLAKVTAQEDLVIGSPVAGRGHADLKNIIGMFVNTLPLRHYPFGEKTFTGFLQEVREKTLQALENQDYPYEYLLEKTNLSNVLNLTRDASRNPLFDTMFALQNFGRPEIEIEAVGFRLASSKYEIQTSKVDLALTVMETDDNLIFTFGYCTKLFKQETIERFIVYFKNIVKQVIENRDGKISGFEIVTEEEKNRVLFEFNDTESEYPKDKPIHELFEEQVERTPDHIAVIGSSSVGALREAPIKVSYLELNRQSERLADEFIKKGTCPDTVIGIIIDRSIEMIIGILGILKAGGAYLPIDPDSPQERKDFMLKDSAAALVCLGAHAGAPLHLNRTSNLAYIIYTSGSTGRPKGVMVEHRNVVRLVKNSGLIEWDQTQRLLMTGALIFDISTFEVWGPLLNGLTLCQVSKETLLNPVKLGAEIIKHAITVLHLIPQLFNRLWEENAASFAGLHYFLIGGDFVNPRNINLLRQMYPGLRIVHCYGPTENTTFSTTFCVNNDVDKDYDERIPIGKPIGNSHVYILDRYQNLLPIGIAGELCVGGDGLARGYLNNPELTSETFIGCLNLSHNKNFCGGPGGGFYKKSPLAAGGNLYKTGDLAKWLMDGNIEFLGRIDHQVKIRGFRIELGEIENRLMAHKHIKDTVVICRSDEHGDKYLVAYVSSNKPIDLAEIKTTLSVFLPDYMIPSFFVSLDRFPLTATGKINREALPLPEFGDGKVLRAPSSDIEKKLAAIWSRVLHLKEDQIGTDVSFFELGGHSLKATFVMTAIQNEFNINLSIADIFQSPTIKGTAELIQKIVNAHPILHMEPAEEKEYYPLSSAQKRLYILEQLTAGTAAYNMPVVLELEGRIEKEVIERIFIRLIDRHESLRTSFETIDGEPVQRIHDHVEFEISEFLTEFTEDTEGEKKKVRRKEDQRLSEIKSFIRSFDLIKAPLIRVGWIKQNDNQHLLIVDMHHIISDGTSMNLLLKEFFLLYMGKELPLQAFQYKDYSEFQQGRDMQAFIKKQETYWLNELAGEIPVLDLPLDYSRPAIQSVEGRNTRFELTVEETMALNTLAKRHQATLFMVLLAIFNIFLAKLSNREDMIIGTPTAGRNHAGLESIIGMFLNTLALRNDPSGEKTFVAFLGEVKEKTLHAFNNQDYPFEDLVEKITVERDMSRNPIFDVMVLLQNIVDASGTGSIPVEAIKHLNGLNVKPLNLDHDTSKLDLTLIAAEQEGQLTFAFEYGVPLFKAETIDRFIRYFKTLTTSVLEAPDRKIHELEILDEEEKHRILMTFNDTRAEYPEDKTIHQLFEEQVERTPDRVAVSGLTSVGALREAPLKKSYGSIRELPLQLTYRRLNEESNRLSNELIEKGIQPNAIVAIMMERSIEMIIAILGILKAGGAYCPIDVDYPQERKDFMLKDSAAALVCPGAHAGAPLQRRISVGADPCVCPGAHTGAPLHSNKNSNIAYIIYTSGTTGTPKGILVEHASVINLVMSQKKEFGIDETERVLQFSPLGFDASVEQIFIALLSGAALIVIDKHTLRDIDKFEAFIINQSITHLHAVPSFLNHIRQNEAYQLKRVIAGGEICPPELAKKWNPYCRFYNEYGPTETTVTSIELLVKEANKETDRHRLPVGKPIDNTVVYILDQWMNLTAPGVIGELVIGGKGLSRGYLNNPELTGEAFCLRRPTFLKKGGTKNFWYERLGNKRLYKTGDLAKWLEDGNIEFLGRIDNQVKIRGFRIELGEIEFHLSRHPEISQAVVIVKEDDMGNKNLCAYMIADREFTASEIREYLSGELPDYMIPSYFVYLNQIPVTANGKINIKALPDPYETGIRDSNVILPKSPVAKKLAEAWENILGRKNIGINENFFHLGGDSIKAIRIISRLNRDGYKLEMKDLFEYPVISELEQHVQQVKRLPDQSPVTGIIPLTPIQKVFFRRSLTQHNHSNINHYNQAVLLHSKNRLDKTIIQAVFTKIQEHHDALRMTYRINRETGDVIQINHGPDYPLSLEEWDIDNGNLERLQTEINRIQSDINLEKGPVMKLGLFHLADGDRLLIVIHHLVVDGVSWRILFEDIDILYRQYTNGAKPALPPKSDSFKLWSEKLSSYAREKELQKEKDYWQRMKTHSLASIPKDFDIDDNAVGDTRHVSFTLGEKETEQLLTTVNKAFGTESNDILLTALALGIKKTFALNRVWMALEGHGREEILNGIDVSRTVGWFTSVYPVIFNVSYPNHYGRQIKEIKETLRRIPNKGIGYGILTTLTGDENPNASECKWEPQISFNYLGQFDADIAQISSFQIAKESAGNTRCLNDQREYLLDVSGIVNINRFIMSISYHAMHFKAETMAALIRNIESELKSIIAFCSSGKTIECTPSDFTYKKLSIDSIDRLMTLYPNAEDLYPLTPMQEGMLFHSLSGSTSQAYFEQISYRLQGEPDIHLVEKSLDELVKRHEVLRTAFVYQDIERPVQIVLKENKIDFYYEDIDPGVGQETNEHRIETFKTRDKERPFDLGKGSLMRVSILRTGHAAYEWIWSFHHLLMDGWCLGIIHTEFLEIYHGYHGYRENRAVRLPEVKPYRLYVQWLEKQDRDASSLYWINYLNAFEEQTGVPKTRRVNTQDTRYKNEIIAVELAPEAMSGLTKLAAENQVTLNTVTQAVWGVLVGKYNEKEDVVFGVVVSGRPYELEGVETMVGLFINTIPVRIRFDECMNFKELFRKVQEEAVSSEPHHHHSLAEIQSSSPLKKDLVDHLFIFENYPLVEQIEGYEKKGKRHHFAFNVANVDIFEQTNYDFNILLSGAMRLSVTLKYNGNVYDGKYVEHIAGHFLTAIRWVIENEEADIRELEILSEDEKKLILDDFNNTKTDYPEDKTIYRLFEEQVEKTPDRVAVSGPMMVETLRETSLQITYSQLNEKADRLAKELIAKGIQPDFIGAIMMKRSIEMLVAILGIFKAGGAYCPIDIDYPQERKDFILNDSKAKLVLVSILENSVGADPRVCPGAHMGAPLHSNKNSNIAYVIYTSGTTGKPKGVMIEHRGMANHIHAKIHALSLNHTAIIAQNASHMFDISVWQFLTALILGGRTVIISDAIIMESVKFMDGIIRNAITVLEVVPSYLSTLLDIDTKNSYDLTLPLKYLLVTGEAVKPGLIEKWFLRYPGINVVNAYGPTEASDDITHYIMDSAPETEHVSIGSPVQNMRIYIVDRSMKLCPIGVKGELIVSGVGVGRGYLNKPELTSERFTRCHLTPTKSFCPAFYKKRAAGGIYYKTGDLARWLPDGNIEFFGRLDHQVKIRGFRIELGEIESRLLQHEDIKEAVVIHRTDERGDRYLVAYLVPLKTLGPSQFEELNALLLKSLPDYMIPSYFVTLDQIPLTPNGKVDRKALPEPQRVVGGKSVNGPRNYIEKRLIGLWAEILGLDGETIGIDDNFFALGGNSLSLIKLFSKITNEFGVTIPMNELYHAPVIRSISRFLFTKNADSREEPVVLLNRRCDRHIFGFPPQLGYGLSYLPLAHLIEKEANHSFYAFSFIEGMEPGERILKYKTIITELQPEGPYILFGYSAGGILAFQVARALEESGLAVSDIILYDSFFSPEDPMARDPQLKKEAMEDYDKYIDDVFEELGLVYLKEKALEKTVKYMAYYESVTALETVCADVHLIVSEEERGEEKRGSWNRWTRGQCRVYQGFGGHMDMFKGDNLAKNAGIVKQILDH
ncbi:MAG: non-ribosomal peptide synthase/polyketide synthase [Candidatus Omnitrophota bacterium]